MSEVDDRLVGDPVWELFPDPGPRPAQWPPRAGDYRRWLALAGMIVVGWLVFPPLAVVTVSLVFAFRDIRNGRLLVRSIPDKAGGKICARFTYAWGAWKRGLAAFVLMFVTLYVHFAAGGRRDVPPAFVAAGMLWMGGFTTAALLTAWGLLTAYRSGMRVWIGEGVNQARTLLLGMLIVGFTLFVLGPMMLWLTGKFPLASDSRNGNPFFSVGFFGCMFGGPIVILLVLDRVSRHIVADRPGKFGPKVSTVGKWDSKVLR